MEGIGFVNCSVFFRKDEPITSNKIAAAKNK
jgi:hypothetical protein